MSDPGIIVDPADGRDFCVWGVDERARWHAPVEQGGSEPGHEIGKSTQFMMVRSRDDGRTWTKPGNMTRQWKDPKWILYAPSPQQGIYFKGRHAGDAHEGA